VMLDRLHVVLRVFRDVCKIASKSQLERFQAQEHTPPLLQVLDFPLAFSYAYLTYILKSQLKRSAAQEHTPPLLQVENALSTPSCLLEPLESELAGVEVDAPPQGLFPPGNVRRRPEAPGNLHLGQAAAVPTYGLLQVDSEDPLFNPQSRRRRM
jgi:hypothetical protein